MQGESFGYVIDRNLPIGILWWVHLHYFGHPYPVGPTLIQSPLARRPVREMALSPRKTPAEQQKSPVVLRLHWLPLASWPQLRWYPANSWESNPAALSQRKRKPNQSQAGAKPSQSHQSPALLFSQAFPRGAAEGSFRLHLCEL